MLTRVQDGGKEEQTHGVARKGSVAHPGETVLQAGPLQQFFFFFFGLSHLIPGGLSWILFSRVCQESPLEHRVSFRDPWCASHPPRWSSAWGTDFNAEPFSRRCRAGSVATCAIHKVSLRFPEDPVSRTFWPEHCELSRVPPRAAVRRSIGLCTSSVRL